MASNHKFESSSGEVAGSYLNGKKKASHPSANLDRSGSLREGSESRTFSSGTITSRGSTTLLRDAPSVGQCLSLDEDKKHTRSVELRRAWGIPLGSTTGENSNANAHPKPSPPAALNHLKRLRGDMLDDSLKARSRPKKFDKTLPKLSRFSEAPEPKKQERNEVLTNRRFGGGSYTSKAGTLVQGNSSDPVPSRLEKTPKNVPLSKRIRSSIAETQAEVRINTLARQPLLMGRDKCTYKESVQASLISEEKIDRLSAGGECWDKKMKKKRSLGVVSTRSLNGVGEIKQAPHNKLNNELGGQSLCYQGDRLGSSKATNTVTKMENIPQHTRANVHVTSTNEPEKESISSGLTASSPKERIIAKVNDHQCFETKRNISRVSRTGTGPVIAKSSSPIFSTPSPIPDKEVGNLSVDKDQLLEATNRCKHPMPIEFSVASYPKWGGQRIKKPRTRRRFPVSPILSQEEGQQSSEGCLSSDLSAKTSRYGTMAYGSHQIVMNDNGVSSPSVISESEESGLVEIRVNIEKVHRLRSHDAEERSPNGSQNTSSSWQGQESNMLNKEDIGDGVHRHGRASGGPSFPKVTLTSAREKSDNTSSIKPLRNLKPDSDKNRSISKSGRLPMKKSDGNSTHLGPRPTGSPDVSGQLDDDRIELFAAAKFACNISDSGCSSPFWKKMETIFAPVSTVTTENLKLQIKGAEAFDETLTQNHSYRNILGDVVHQEGFPSDADLTIERERSETASELLSKTTESCAPLYQRVLSALILVEELENNGVRGIEQEPMSGLQNQYEHLVGRPLCNGSASLSKGTLPENSHLQGYQGLANPQIPVNYGERPVSLHTHPFKATSFDCEYEKMSLDNKLLLELQSIGIYIEEPVPDLKDREDETISQEIDELCNGLQQQVSKKEKKLKNIIKVSDEVQQVEEGGREQDAMDRLVELAYAKRMATPRSSCSRSGVNKIANQSAERFIKRTLDRCHGYEATGRSCFSEGLLHDTLFGASTERNSAGSIAGPELGCPANRSNQEFAKAEPLLSGGKKKKILALSSPGNDAKTGLLLSGEEKKEVLFDDVGGSVSLRALSSPVNNISGRRKEKRSEREGDIDYNSVAKIGRKAGERKTKPKPKPKPKAKAKHTTAQLGKTSTNKLKESTNSKEQLGSNNVIEESAGLNSPNNNPPKELLDAQIPELNGLRDELLNFDDIDAELQDYDCIGLPIPMDDIGGLNLF